jgi:hypothetical protein
MDCEDQMKQADVIRDMRRAAGLPIEDRSEEELLKVPARTPDFAIKEVQDLSGMNDYWVTEATATPGLDAVAKKDVSAKLSKAVAQASKAADQAEKAVSAGKRPQTKAAVAAAYSMLDALRPAISSRELEALRGMTVDVAKQAKMLIIGLQKLDKEHYGPLTQGVSDLSARELASKLHALWSQMDLVARVYKQYRAAYGV